jgi:hypothetical protein
MLYGIPGAAMIFLCYVTACLRPRSKFEGSNLTEQEKHLKYVLTTILGVTIWIGLTVHFWASAYILTMFLTGIRAHLGALEVSFDQPESDTEDIWTADLGL